MNPPLSILLVEDDARDSELVERELRRAGLSFRLRCVVDRAGFVDALNEPPDLVLSDYELPQFDGLAALSILKERAPDVPFILVSGTIGEDLAVAAMRLGATDYLLKDRLSRLSASVSRALEQSHLLRQQRETAAALDRAESRYRGIFENAVEGMFQCAPSGQLTTANPAMARIFGFQSSEELVHSGRNVLGELHTVSSERATLLELLAREEVLRSVDAQARRRDGSRFWARVNARRIDLPSGERVYEGTLEDITEKKELEERLLRADRMESLGRLAAGVAHDLNNILLPIMISQSLLREHLHEPEQTELLETIETSARRGASVLKQLLTFARGGGGEHFAIRVATVVGEMYAIMRETFPRNIAVRTTMQDPDAWVTGDPTQIHQVLMNLCVNARDAMPEGGELTLTVRTVELDEVALAKYAELTPGRYVELSVRDSGVGIAPEHLNQIFDPFFTTKELGQGTGLGLSSVLGIVKSHGGFIEVDTVVGRGTDFRVCLPASLQSDERPLARPQPGTAWAGRGRLILLVEDEEVILSLFRVALSRFGYRLVEASDGVAGLAQYERYRSQIALVVSDLSMPRLDGMGFIQQLRKRDAELGIVVMTGLTSSGSMARLQALGVRHLLKKPFCIDDLVAVVQRAMPPTQKERQS